MNDYIRAAEAHKAMLARRRVYFMGTVEGHGPVKVGCTSWLDGRLRTMTFWSPYPLEILASFPGNLDDEGRVHSYLRAYHSHGEWFHQSPLMGGLIASILAGNFDIETLPPTIWSCARRGRKPSPSAAIPPAPTAPAVADVAAGASSKQ
jgi:hypothetical protein